MKELPISAPEQIIQLIPQRSPMVMVDTLWEYTPETAVVGLTITQENIFVQEGNLSASGLIGAIKHIEIQALPKKGEAIRTHITILQEFMEVTLVRMETYIQDICIAQGEMKTVLAK